MTSALSRRSLVAGIGGAAVATAAAQLSGATASAAPSTASLQLLVPPLRINDTRTNGQGKVDATHPLDTFVPGLIAQNTVGAMLNITITETEGSGYIVANADNASAPNPTSNINWSQDGQILANLALVPGHGTHGITVAVGGPGRTHVVLDLVALLVQ
jgi:hypothetical protein